MQKRPKRVDEYSIYKACSKKDRTFGIKTLFYNILSTVPFKVVSSTGDTPFSTFLPLLECALERTFCDGAQFSYRIFLNIRVFKKRQNFWYKDFILQHFKNCPLQSSSLYWRYTVPNVSSSVGMLPERTFCDGAQFSHCIFLNLCGLKKKTELFK